MKRNLYLKVKIKSLAAEAKIIRAEELKLKKQGRGEESHREELYLHRIIKVRREARLSLLAYQFMRGVPYAACEKPRKENHIREKDIEHMASMINRFVYQTRTVVNRQVDLGKWLEGGASPFAKEGPRLPSVRSQNGFSQSAA